VDQVSVSSSGDVLKAVRQTIGRYGLLAPGGAVIVAVSGGPDSLCLLHVLRVLSEEYSIRLHAAHLNHCLRGEDSAGDARFVEEVASGWEIPVTVATVDVAEIVRQRKGSIEEVARRVRYGFLAEVAHRVGADRIAVGHNADDQTETVLMHWLRGAGLAGLRGMLPKSPVGDLRLGMGDSDSASAIRSDLYLIRPLLHVSRVEIEAYCRAHDLRPRFDLSNLDTTYYRNRLRLQLIPYLEGYNPNIREVIRRSAEVAAADHDVLCGQVDLAWRDVLRQEEARRIVLNLAQWRALPLGLQRSVLRLAVQKLRHHLRDIAWEHVENAVWIGRERETGTQATLPDGLLLTVGYNELVLSDFDAAPDLALPYPWLDVDHLGLTVPGVTALGATGWMVRATLLDVSQQLYRSAQANADPCQAFLDAHRLGRLSFRRRQPGDRFHPLGMSGHAKSLREFLINTKIPERWRGLLPILVSRGRADSVDEASPEEIVWVAGWRIDETFKVMPSTRRILHLWLELQ